MTETKVTVVTNPNYDWYQNMKICFLTYFLHDTTRPNFQAEKDEMCRVLNISEGQEGQGSLQPGLPFQITLKIAQNGEPWYYEQMVALDKQFDWWTRVCEPSFFQVIQANRVPNDCFAGSKFQALPC